MISGICVFATPVLGMGFAYGFGRFVQNTICVLLLRPCFIKSSLQFQGRVGIWWIPKCAGSAFRLWFALVGRFVELPFSRKRPAIEMIEITEMIEMIEMIWVPLAGNVLHSGGGRGRREAR